MPDKKFVKRKWQFWSRDMIEKFIVLLKKHECLYNNKNKFYYNRYIKDEVCELILQEMRKHKPAIQIDDIRRKMKVLRTQFARENRSLALAQLHGKEYQPKLWCYDKLSFLEKHTTCVNSVHNKDLITSPDDANIFSDEETCTFDENEDSSLRMEIYKEEELITDNSGDAQNETLKIQETNFENTEPFGATEKVKIKEKTESGKYNWIGDLVVSQIEEIGLDHRGDFIWDIQCLVRKYLLKSKITTENDQHNNPTETEATTMKDVTLHKGSNISVNVNFL